MITANIRLDNVTFAYADKIILDSFSLDLADCGITAIAGPSGCGKTTLLRLLAGLEMPRRGTVTAPPPEATAILFQENRLLPGLTAAGQLSIVLPPGEDPLHWLAAVGLAAEADTMPPKLSGGMQRRLALARCLAYGRDKALLLLDEPFTGIDPQRAADIMAFIRTLGVPVLYCAHDDQSLSLGDRILRLDGPPLRRL